MDNIITHKDLGWWTPSFNTGISTYTIGVDLCNSTKYNVSEEEGIWTLEAALPGLKLEDFKIKVKKDQLVVTIEESTTFVDKEELTFNFDFDLKPKMITSELDEGVLTIVVVKPEDYEFEVDVD